jgi:hypothetical protein
MERCSATITGYWGSNFMRSRQCRCNGSVTRDGKPFCWQHDPETAEAREAAKKEKRRLAFEADRPRRIAIYQAKLRAKAKKKADNS